MIIAVASFCGRVTTNYSGGGAGEARFHLWEKLYFFTDINDAAAIITGEGYEQYS
jgi:hypothetical protein